MSNYTPNPFMTPTRSFAIPKCNIHPKYFYVFRFYILKVQKLKLQYIVR